MPSVVKDRWQSVALTRSGVGACPQQRETPNSQCQNYWRQTSWKRCENIPLYYIVFMTLSSVIVKICHEKAVKRPWKCCESFQLLNLSWKYVCHEDMSWNCRENMFSSLKLLDEKFVKNYSFITTWWQWHDENVVKTCESVMKHYWHQTWKSRENIHLYYIIFTTFSSDVVKMCHENVLKKLWKCHEFHVVSWKIDIHELKKTF